MQQPREPELTLNQVRKEINLVDLVLMLGYQLSTPASESDAAKTRFYTFNYQGKPALDQVLIYKASSGELLYVNRADDRDKGDVISFIKNRLENPRIAGLVATLGKDLWVNVLENAQRLLQLPAAARRTSPHLQRQLEPGQG